MFLNDCNLKLSLLINYIHNHLTPTMYVKVLLRPSIAIVCCVLVTDAGHYNYRVNLGELNVRVILVDYSLYYWDLTINLSEA